MTQMSASRTSRIWLPVRVRMPMKIDTCWVISSVAKVTPKTRPKYLLRSPVSMRSAIQLMASSSAQSARDDQRLARDPRRIVRGQEDGGGGNVPRLADAAQRRLRDGLALEVAGDNPGAMGALGLYHARIDGVDPDFARPQLLGERPRDRIDGRLRG